MVFSLISCYDEMTKTRDKLEGDDEKKRKIFATVQFVLGVLETLFLVGEIGLEMAGMLAASTLCGVASVGMATAFLYCMTPTSDLSDTDYISSVWGPRCYRDGRLYYLVHAKSR